MSDVKIILSEIQKLRSDLNRLTKDKSDLIDPEVIYVSQKLDIFLNKYYRTFAKNDRQA